MTWQIASPIKKLSNRNVRSNRYNVLCLVAQSCPTMQPYGLQPARLPPLSMGFSRQDCWSVLLCTPPRDLPNPEIQLHVLHWHASSLPLVPPGKPLSPKGRITEMKNLLYGLNSKLERTEKRTRKSKNKPTKLHNPKVVKNCKQSQRPQRQYQEAQHIRNWSPKRRRQRKGQKKFF